VRRRRRVTVDPLDGMPAELRVYDDKEWAAPGERPCANGFAFGDWAATWDHHRAHARYCKALVAWFDAHPDADCIPFLQRGLDHG
jgi:hypothetical protein